MILELGDGREIQLPDEMSDETARQIKRLILALEERTRAAESEARLLRDEMVNLRAVVTAPKDYPEPEQMAPHLVEIIRLLRQLVAVESADRMLVTDDIGRSRSRVVS